jgi:Flp pilus assembly protein TadG
MLGLGRLADAVRRLGRRVRALGQDDRGNILMIAALTMPVWLAGLGLGFETASWYQIQRQMQNAADSAAIAASSNGGSGYGAEARSVTAQYGFTNGADGVTVTVSNTATCPAGGTTCYSVTISKPVQLVLAGMVGFTGDTVSGGKAAKLISATSTASKATSPRSYCILALASSGASQGIRANGVPKADLNGCDVMSNTDTVCNGHNLDATHGDAHGSSSGCGTEQTSNLPVLADPYASLAANIPADPCTTYGVLPEKKKDPDTSTKISGSVSWSNPKFFCGDVQLTGDVTITSTTVVVIKNGQLNLNGYTLKTASGVGVTIIFTGTSGTHTPTGGGTLDIAAPTSGTWSGVAIYQDPSMTSGVDISEAGNTPTWNITGLVYLPHSTVTLSGAVNKSANGYSCFALVVDNVTFNGTGSILTQGQCTQAGLSMPTANIPSRGQLVL